MTNLDDFDRSLNTFLADGPNTAPEAPVIAAMAHARTTPRRPDPLRAFRADPMAPRRTALGVRPGLVLAVLAVSVATVGVAIVGSQPSDPAVPNPSDAATVSPSAQATFRAEIPVQVSAGQPLTLTVTDATGELVGAVSSTPGDGASVGNGAISLTADPADVNVLIATWSGSPCQTRAAMVVDELASTVTVAYEDCTGDAVAFDRVVRLSFDKQVDANAWRGSVPQDLAPGVSPSLPPDPTALHIELTGQCCGSPTMDVVDRSGHLSSVVAIPGTDVTGDSLTATNDDPRTVRLTWLGSPCDTVHLLTIAADFGLRIDRPICHGDAMATFRGVILTFDEPVDADALDTAIADGRPDSGLPTWTATAPDAAGNRYDLAVFDPGAVVESIEGSFDPGVGAAGAGPTGIRLEQLSATSFRLIWLAQGCAARPVLSVDPAANRWQLANAPCAAPSEVLRMIDVTLKQAPAGGAAPTIEATTQPG